MFKYLINISRSSKNNPVNSIYHSPLIVDAGTQSSYRKAGFVSWPQVAKLGDNDSDGPLKMRLLQQFWRVLKNRVKGVE